MNKTKGSISSEEEKKKFDKEIDDIERRMSSQIDR